MAVAQESAFGAPVTLPDDIEKYAFSDNSLKNDTVRDFAWQDVTVTIKDRGTKLPKAILANVDGYVEAGEANFTAPLA